MSLVRPNAIFTTPSGDLSAAEAALARLQISMSGEGTHDSAQVVVWPDSKLASLAAGDALSIKLGDAGQEEAVFAGEIVEVTRAADGVLLEALSATVVLSRSRRSQTFLGQSIADIVRDLAKGVTVDEVQGDTTLDAYAVDDRRSIWEHVLELARLAGAEVGSGPDGGLRFVPVSGEGSADLTLRYGADLLSHHLSAHAVAGNSARATALGAEGGEKWHWIAHEPAPSGSGDGPVRLVAAFRTHDAADALQTAIDGQAARAASRGRIEIFGDAKVRPGQRVQIDGLPGGGASGPVPLPQVGGLTGGGEMLRVLRVDHVLDGRLGLRTTLEVEGTGGGGGGLLGGLL